LKERELNKSIMNTIIEVTFKNDKNKNKEVFSVILNNEEVKAIAQKKGLKAANTAIEGFTKKFIGQYKEKFSEYISNNI
jgi:hypothetical protein